VEQAQVVVVQIAEHDVENRAAAQGEKHHEFKEGKAAALLLNWGLGIAFLVFPSIRQLRRGGVNRFDGPAIDLSAQAGAPVGSLSRGAHGFFQSLAWKALPGLNIGGVAFINPAVTVQPEQSLNMADDLATGGSGFEYLPQKAFAGQAQAEDALAAVRALLGG